jgi:hypothetical protein
VDLSKVVDALCAVEIGAQPGRLSPSVASEFLAEAIHFRRTVAYASLRLTAELTRHEEPDVRARAATALVAFWDVDPVRVEDLLLECCADPSAPVREATIDALAILIAHVPHVEAIIARWRAHSRAAAQIIREARRRQPF